MTDTKIFGYRIPSKYLPYAAAAFAAAAGFALPVSGMWYEANYGHAVVVHGSTPAPRTVTATREVEGPPVAVPGPAVTVTRTRTAVRYRTSYVTVQAGPVTATRTVTVYPPAGGPSAAGSP